MKNKYLTKHDQLCNDRFNAVFDVNEEDNCVDINLKDIQKLSGETYSMGADTGYDNALDDVEKMSIQIAACGVGIFAGVKLGKALRAKFFEK